MNYIGIVKEPALETRLCFLPKEVALATQQLNIQVLVEEGLGSHLCILDEAYTNAGATVTDRVSVLSKSTIILSIHQITDVDLSTSPKTFIGYFNALFFPEKLKHYLNTKVSVFSLDLLPRTTIAQSMDVLSSMASLSGYKAVLIATNYYASAIPMFTTAAGTLTPARVLVLGAGVAGLQAIATAKRLGAVVEAFDVRKSSAEEVQSLGATFIEVPGYEDSENTGGYAVTQTQEYMDRQKKLIQEHISKANIVIATANIPGKKAPLLIDFKALDAMQPGSVIVDLSAEQGGNCAATKNAEITHYKQITIIGDSFLTRRMPQAASQLLSVNYLNFLKHKLNNDKEDDLIIHSCQIIKDGKSVHPQLTNTTITA